MMTKCKLRHKEMVSLLSCSFEGLLTYSVCQLNVCGGGGGVGGANCAAG